MIGLAAVIVFAAILAFIYEQADGEERQLRRACANELAIAHTHADTVAALHKTFGNYYECAMWIDPIKEKR